MKTTSNLSVAVIITAAGSSTRMGGSLKKEYLPLNNGTVLTNSAKTFLNTLLLNSQITITDFVITCPVDGIEDCKKTLATDKDFNILQSELYKKTGTSLKIVEGSTTRQSSVFNGLLAVEKNNRHPKIVMIHDGARPFVTPKIIQDGLFNAQENGASVPGITPTDTQKQIDKDGFIICHLQRASLTAVQTPQSFDFEKLLSAHKNAAADKTEYTDDTEIWGKYCGKVKVFEGDSKNIKITYHEDLNLLKRSNT